MLSNTIVQSQESTTIKELNLIKLLKNSKKVLVAFSGGVDSTYLLALARETLGQNAGAVFARGAMIAPHEQEEAVSLARTLDIPLNIIDLDVLALDNFVENPVNRCYYCKQAVFGRFLEIAQELGYNYVVDGTNFSDDNDFRPGRKALYELGIVSPLRQALLTKNEIRQLSHARGLPTWDKPSMACLASRIPYGDTITSVILKQVTDAEQVLRRRGYIESRVRIHGYIARIEIPNYQFSSFLNENSEITGELLALGFRYVTLDLQGFRSGSLNPQKGSEQ